VEVLDLQALTYDIWAYNLQRPTLTRLTFDKTNFLPIWSADGKRLFFTSASSVVESQNLGIRSLAADSSSPAVTVIPSDGSGQLLTSVSPDGKLMIGTRGRPRDLSPNFGGSQIWVQPQGGKPQVFLESRFTKTEPQFSADGRWIAFQSNDTGKDEIYVVPYPGPGGKSQVSIDGGRYPRWAHNGRELFFRSGDKMMVVDVETGATFRAGTPKMLFEKPGTYDVSADGKRFLMIKPDTGAQGQPGEMQIVVNWFEEVGRRAPSGK
jgi:Tol biopolymer transport system component